MSTTLAKAVLSSGSAHEDVFELGRLLGKAGFPNSVTDGTNAYGLVDESILRAVNAYRVANGVPDESTIPNVPPHEARNWIGPELWKAITRRQPAAKTKEAKA